MPRGDLLVNNNRKTEANPVQSVSIKTTHVDQKNQLHSNTAHEASKFIDYTLAKLITLVVAILPIIYWIHVLSLLPYLEVRDSIIYKPDAWNLFDPWHGRPWIPVRAIIPLSPLEIPIFIIAATGLWLPLIPLTAIIAWYITGGITFLVSTRNLSITDKQYIKQRGIRGWNNTFLRQLNPNTYNINPMEVNAWILSTTLILTIILYILMDRLIIHWWLIGFEFIYDFPFPINWYMESVFWLLSRFLLPIIIYYIAGLISYRSIRRWNHELYGIIKRGIQELRQ